MFEDTVQIRVRYAETDQMGYVYYGNYAAYFEVGRVEALRKLGLSYKEMEAGGIMLPVLDYQAKFLKPAFYDDLLTVKTTIIQKPGVRIVFHYEVFNQENILLTTGQTTLVFILASSKKPCQPPISFMSKISAFF